MKRVVCILMVLMLLMLIWPVLISVHADSITIPHFTKYDQNPILKPRKVQQGQGQTIYFDSASVTDPTVVYANGKYHMWFTGWVNWLSGSGRQGRIGYAISSDGKVWSRVDGVAGGVEASGAVLGPGASNEFDSRSVQSPFVMYDDGKYRMFYVGVDSSGRSTLGLAESVGGEGSGGIYWTKKGQVLPTSNELAFDGFQLGRCSVSKISGVYKMWYEGQSKVDSRWRIGYATSYDGLTWTKNIGDKTGGAVLDIGDKVTDFDVLCVRAPCVVFDGVNYFMWYDTSMRDEKSAQVGVVVSSNGTVWEKKGISLDVGKPGDFDAQRVASPSVVKIGLVYKMYYCNFTDTNSGIGMATSGEIAANIGSGIVKLDCKAGDGFDFSLGNKTTDPTLADFLFDCGFGTPRMCGRYIPLSTDFDNTECVPAEGYPAIASPREFCQNIEVGKSYGFKTIPEQNYAKIKIEGIWQDPTDPTHYEITIKWMYQSNGSNCFIGGPGDPPGKPFNLNCIAGDRSIKIKWTASFAPPGRIISYYVYRADASGEAAKSKNPIHDFPTNTVEYTDSGLINNKTYYYVIRAVDQFGNTSESSNECFATPMPLHPPPFPTPPTIPGGNPGKGTPDNPYIVESNPWLFDWCGFQPATLVIIQGRSYVADNSGCIHVSLELNKGINNIEYIIITPTGDTITGSVAVMLKDSSTHLELWIGRSYMLKNSQQISLDAPPEIKSGTGRTFIPFRAVAEALGATVTWDDKQRKVTVTDCDPLKYLNKIELWIGKPTALVNGQPIQIDSNSKVVPYIKNGRTMVPIRFISETLGATVNWIEIEKKVDIVYNPPKCP